MTQYLVRSLHRAVRGWSYALTDRKPGRRETLDTDVKVIEVADGLSLREAVQQQKRLALQETVNQLDGAPWITSL